MVRAKFKCSQKIEDAGGKTVKLSAVIGDTPENKDFFKYTPSGEISLGILNDEAANAFEVGKEYYIDFTPAN